MAPRKRLCGKQADQGSGQKKTKQKEPALAKESKDKAIKRPTRLSVAKKVGLVQTALRPFAMFCKEKRLRAQEGSVAWKQLSGKEKQTFEQLSRESFAAQRLQTSRAGLQLRKRQCDESEKGLRFDRKIGGFAAFLRDTGKHIKEGSSMWKQLPQEEKEKYFQKPNSQSNSQTDDPTAAVAQSSSQASVSKFDLFVGPTRKGGHVH